MKETSGLHPLSQGIVSVIRMGGFTSQGGCEICFPEFGRVRKDCNLKEFAD